MFQSLSEITTLVLKYKLNLIKLQAGKWEWRDSYARCGKTGTTQVLAKVKANSWPWFPTKCQRPGRRKLIRNGHISLMKGTTLWFRCNMQQQQMNHYTPQLQRVVHYTQHLSSLWNFVSTETSRDHSESPIGILTAGECTRNRLTLLGNATVHCKKGIFYEEQFIRHLVLMLHGGQLSDVTSLRPLLASGAAADRSDIYSGSVNVSYRVVYH